MKILRKPQKQKVVKVIVGQAMTGDTRITGKSRSLTVADANHEEVFKIVKDALEAKEAKNK